MAKLWVFSFTPTELWEELEKLADAIHQHFYEGVSRNPPSKGGNAKNLNNTRSKDGAICLSFGHTNCAKSHSTENHWWNRTDAERVAQEASKDPPKAPVKKVDENCQSTRCGKGKGSKGQQTSGGKGGPLALTSAHSLGMSRELATGLALLLGKIAFSTITLGGIGLAISIFKIFSRASLAGWALVDERKDHLVRGTLIQVVGHQCTKLLVPTRITIIM